MPSRNLMGIVMAALAVLLAPVLVASAALLALFLYLFITVPLCPRISSAATGSITACAQCFPFICHVLAALFIFVVLPLAAALLIIFKRRTRLP